MKPRHEGASANGLAATAGGCVETTDLSHVSGSPGLHPWLHALLRRGLGEAWVRRHRSSVHAQPGQAVGGDQEWPSVLTLGSPPVFQLCSNTTRLTHWVSMDTAYVHVTTVRVVDTSHLQGFCHHGDTEDTHGGELYLSTQFLSGPRIVSYRFPAAGGSEKPQLV